MLKNIFLATLLFFTITLSAAVGSGSEEGPTAEEILDELKGVGSDFGDQVCTICLQPVNLIPLPLEELDAITSAAGMGPDSDLVQTMRIVVSRLNEVSRTEYDGGELPEAKHEAICTRVARRMWEEMVYRQVESPNEMLIFNAEGIAQDRRTDALNMYAKYLVGGGMEEIMCSRDS